MPTIDVAGRKLHYRQDGPEDAPVLMLSNSLGTESGLWDPQMPALAESFRVLRYDTLGHGQSEVPDGPLSIEDLGRSALGLIDALGIGQVDVLGLSLGGMTGMWLAAEAPERVRRLVLANTSAHMANPEAWNARIEAVREGGMEAIVSGVLERWLTARFREIAPGAVEAVRRMLLATPPDGYVACCAAVRDLDLRGSLPSIRAPTLVIAGRHDEATPVAHAEAIRAAVEGARLVVLEAAHLSNVEAASDFDAAVVGFLRDG
jgi:3-oxoadipate enol-lactonase